MMFALEETLHEMSLITSQIISNLKDTSMRFSVTSSYRIEMKNPRGPKSRPLSILLETLLKVSKNLTVYRSLSIYCAS
jgi:hypothetical protein